MKKNLLIAHSGGPTAVINASLYGVIKEAMKYEHIDKILGARYGVEGIFTEDFINLKEVAAEDIEKLPFTPSSAIGSCRQKVDDDYILSFIDIIKRNNIGYFLITGGNGSMNICSKMYKLSLEAGIDVKVIGIPKTIDNDLAGTDHSPGFGSAARFSAICAQELAAEVKALPIHVVVLELMGRNAGWITAASALAKKDKNIGPHLIYLPERPFVESVFLEDVRAEYEKHKDVLIVVSEGLADQRGNMISSAGIIDGSGHQVPGGVAQTLSNLIVRKLGINSRAEKPGLLGRNSVALQSSVDRLEAIGVGRYAVEAAVSGKSGYMVAIKRNKDIKYKVNYDLVPLSEVISIERKFPLEWINERGNFVKQEFYEYCCPLIGDPLPNFASF